MNINSNELLVLKRNMKFRGEEPAAAPTAAVTEPSTQNPQAGLNVLETQGANNIAFQGVRTQALKKMGLNALLALTLLGGAATATSCSDDNTYIPSDAPVEVTVNVNVDLSQMTAMYQKMLDMYQLMLEQQQITNSTLTQLNQNMLKFMEEYKNGQITANEFYEKMYQMMITNEANQQAIISLLVSNGKSQEEANAFIQQLIAEVQAGNISAAEAYDKIIKELGDIKNILTVNLEAMRAFQQEMLEISKQMVTEQQMTNEQMNINNQKLQELIDKYAQGQIDAKEFYAQMYNFMVNDSMNQQIIIRLLVKNGKSQEQANRLIQDLIAQVKAGNLTAAEAYDKIMKELGSINGTLGDILAELKNISENITMFRESYEQGKKENLEMLGNIYNQNKINTSYLKAIGQGLSVMNENLISINNNVLDLKAIAADDTKFRELMEQLKSMDKNDVDYKKFEEMFKLLNMNLTNVINKSTSDITGAINDVNSSINNFQNTYIETEKNQTEQLTNISNKLEIIANFPGLDSEGIKEALDALTDAVNNNTTNVTTELKNIQAALDAVLAKLDAMLKEVATLSQNVTTYYQNFDKKFDSAIDRLIAEFNTSLSGVKAEQQVANKYLEYLCSKVDELNVKIDNLNQGGGNSGITLEELEALWKERDEANYNKYKALIESLGIKIDVTNATLADLKAEIEAWKQDQKDYSAQLNTIISKLDGINWSSPDYSAKLDKVIELLTNFKCNCQCSGNKDPNEGIIDDLEDLLH